MPTYENSLVIMPAYNEEKSLAEVVRRVRIHCPGAAIAVMNDGSVDNTLSVAKAAGVILLDVPINLGIGGAVQTGLKFAARERYERAIEIDADGQHNPAFTDRLMTAMDETGADMVIGSRFVQKTRYKATFMRTLGIAIFSDLIRLVTGKRIYDTTSGFRVYNRRAIEFLARHYPTDFPEPESIVMLLKNRFVLKEVPVEMEKRQAGVSSVFKWRAAYFMASISIAIIISSLKRRWP